MPFRNTKGIVTEDGDPDIEADVIMTAAALGFAASIIEETKDPVRFDMDPLEAKDENKFKEFTNTVSTMNKAIDAYLTKNGIAPGETEAGLSPKYEKGAVIMGVYRWAGKTAPQQVDEPVLSEAGQRLYDSIKNMKVPQYTGRGAYTGFVDNKNTEGDTNPVGPRSTARFLAPAPGTLHPDPHPRWLPPLDSPLWTKRKRKEDGTYVPWGMIGGDLAGEAPTPPTPPNTTPATNRADQITADMGAGHDGMIFNGDVTPNDIAAYTHGMIQAIYKAYDLGPNCEPYEIAVGDNTTKMASCLPCTLFMYATGYPPNSIHLGRGESWAPLYHPYNPNGSTDAHESEVIRDLNNAWYENCLNWLKKGLEILDDTPITENHKASHKAVKQYLSVHAANAFEADPTINLRSPAYTVGGVLILDAVTLHKAEIDRIKSTLAAG